MAFDLDGFKLIPNIQESMDKNVNDANVSVN